MKPYTLGIYEKAMPAELSWKEKMETAKAAGYDFIEISIDETEEKLKRLDMGKEDRLELVRLMYETGMPIRTMCLSGHRKYPLGSSQPEVSGRGMEIMEKALELAEDLGIRIIQLAGYDVYYEEGSEETRKRFAKNLKKAVEMAAAKGIVLGFETMETPFMNTVQKSMKYVNLVDSLYLNVYPDLGNITNAAKAEGGDVIKDLETGRVYISSQNHGYAVDVNSLNPAVAKAAFENVNDKTNEGLKYTGKNIFTVQFHPEACPGPQDSGYLFDRFMDMMKGAK